MPIGGPKLRKWYGAPDQLPKDGSDGQRDDDAKGAQDYLFFMLFLLYFLELKVVCYDLEFLYDKAVLVSFTVLFKYSDLQYSVTYGR